MKQLFLILGYATILLLTSCEKEEKPWALPPLPDSVSVQQIDMGSDYNNQVYYDFQNGIVRTVDNRSWDLAFDAAANGFLISMNGGTNVLIATLPDTQFVTDAATRSLQWNWDAACGTFDSLAMHNWCDANLKSNGKVYVINRGLPPGEPNNFFQFKVKGVNAQSYQLIVADANGQQMRDIAIPKDPAKQHVFYSFANGGSVVDIEPAKTDWDLCFLQYRWIYHQFSPPLLYQVSGVFINNTSLEAAVDSSMQFYDIKAEQCVTLSYRKVRDVIGYDWKTPIFKPTGVDYETRKHVNYIVREQGGVGPIYKLRFVDFYNHSGVKGTPTFEWQQLR
jgi:hypothetical protein